MQCKNEINVFFKNEIDSYVKKISLAFFKGKSVESLPSKLPKKRGESQLDILKYQVFLSHSCY